MSEKEQIDQRLNMYEGLNEMSYENLALVHDHITMRLERYTEVATSMVTVVQHIGNMTREEATDHLVDLDYIRIDPNNGVYVTDMGYRSLTQYIVEISDQQ